MSTQPEPQEKTKEYTNTIVILFSVTFVFFSLLGVVYYMDLTAKEITELRSQLHSLANQFQSFRDIEEMRHKQIYNLTTHLKRVFLDQ